MVDPFELAARHFEPGTRLRFPTPGHLAAYTTPKTVHTPALDLIDQHLVDAFNTPDARLIITMAPQEGKSVRVAGDFPLWALIQNKDLRIVAASYGQRLADRNGRSIRNRIVSNPDLGLRIARDNGSVSEWQLDGYDGGVYSVGIGGPLSGRPADLMIIDDPIKGRKEAESPTFRDNVWDWWTDVAAARLAPGAPVILILTRWHHDDLAGRLLATNTGWRLLNIPAQADHNPTNGEVDVLGREPGEFMVSARGRTQDQWEARKTAAGPRSWASLYQGRPTPDTGGVFPKQWAVNRAPIWVERDDGTRWVPGADEVIQSWDLAFKDKDTSDYVAWGVWARTGTTVHLVDVGHARLSFTATLAKLRAVTAKWPQAVGKLVEDKANGPAVINALRTDIPGIIPVEPEGSKYSRAVAVSPFCHAGNVILPDPLLVPGVVDLTEETDAFPNGKHDDLVDMLTQAVNQLLLHPILTTTGDVLTPEDLFTLENPHAYLGGY